MSNLALFVGVSFLLMAVGLPVAAWAVLAAIGRTGSTDRPEDPPDAHGRDRRPPTV